ncbi:MAG: ribosome-associated protein [Myxococcota bacterium]|jgi:ribosome-associated protein
MSNLLRESIPLDSKTLALRLTALAFDKKAFQLKVLEVANLVGYCDYFVIASGRSDRQVKAIAENITLTMKNEHSMLPKGIEGNDGAQWVLIDYGDVVVHLFNAPVRDYYDLDGLWAEAVELPIEQPAWEEEMRNSVFDQGVVFQP